MQIHANGPELRPDPPKELLNLVRSVFSRAAIISATSRHASMPSFSGTCPRMVSPALSSPPMRDGVFWNEVAHVLEAHRRLVQRHAVQSGDGVQHMRSRHAARRAHFPAARFEQVIVQQAENMVGRNPVPSASRMPKRSASPSVARPTWLLFCRHGFAERRQIFLRKIGPGAVEDHVAIGANAMRAAMP